jgi:hypothetical protein
MNSVFFTDFSSLQINYKVVSTQNKDKNKQKGNKRQDRQNRRYGLTTFAYVFKQVIPQGESI